MENRPVLAFGQFRKNEQISLQVIAQEAALDLEISADAAEIGSWLENHLPLVLLVDSSSASAEHVCLTARSQAKQALTPIISVSRGLDDLCFAEVFTWGGDDVVDLDSPRPLLARVRALPREQAVLGSATRGVAVVADPDRARRLVRARVLRNAGFDIQFAITVDDARSFATQENVRLLVVDAELDAANELVQTSAKGHPSTTHILMCPPKELSIHAAQLRELENAAAADGFAPPENVVFLANELERGGRNDQRSSRRLLYGTKLGFRAEGREVDDIGFTYNLSRGGMYVRTLAPPKEDHVWLELYAPRTDRKVRLEGEVVWRRGFGPAHTATVPPGFGVRIADGTRKDMAIWQEGYNEFCRSLGLDSRPTAQPSALG